MIKFFRKIRQKLLSENKFSKYLIYAVGEIVLVVVGILIALQLNAWHSERQKLKKEITYLKELEKNLAFNLESEIIAAIEYTKERRRRYEIFISEVESFPNGISADSIGSLLNWHGPWELQINMSAYDDLISIGMDLISNDELRKEISQLYAYQIPRSIDHNKNHWNWSQQNIYPMFHDNLDTKTRHFTPSQVEFLKTNLAAKNRMHVFYDFYSQGFLWRLETLRPEAESALKNIREEIKRLEEK